MNTNFIMLHPQCRRGNANIVPRKNGNGRMWVAVGKRKKRKKRVYNLQRKLIAAVRRVFFYSPLRYEASKKAKTKDGKYKCNNCGRVFERAIIDHIQPVVHLEKGFEGWSTYVRRLFCSVHLLQNLCTQCHKTKSAAERKVRQKYKK